MSAFTVKSSGTNKDSINDWYDLDELFREDFFPRDVDFSNVFSFEDGQSNNFDIDLDDIKSVGADGGSMTTNRPVSTNKVIMIPPLMPRTSAPLVTSSSGTHLQHTNKQSEWATSSANRKAGRVSTTAAVSNVGRKKQDRRSKLKEKGREEREDQYAPDEDEDDYDDLDNTDIANMTEGQRLERRDRNREHAKRSRIRKRVLLDTLQGQLAALRQENVMLRRVVADRLPGDLAAHILTECTTEESTLLVNLHTGSSDEGGEDVFGWGSGVAPRRPSALTTNIAADVVHRSGKEGGTEVQKVQKVLMEPDYRLIHSLITSQQNFVLTDPSLPDNPIVYASDGFCRLSGYRRQDVLGRNCRFLQGPGTDRAAVNLIRQGIAEGRDITVCLLNYRADGSPFWNQFFLGALKDADGQVVNYVGVQCAVNTVPISEMKDRVKKLPLPDA